MDKVMVAMSGGVDSSVALLLLKECYEVIGATLRLYSNEDIKQESRTCCSLRDIEDARFVASKFGVKHYVFNFSELFKKDVIERFNKSYLNGETPNPCIDCNKYIKFDAMLERAISLSCQFLATGHYARIEYDKASGRWLLKKALSGTDINEKDQSYVLYNLTQEQLAHVIFPLGSIDKEKVRTIAEKNELVNSQKPDSQDICFVPDGDYAGFIERYAGIVPQKGNVVSTQGKLVGTHDGLIHYTIGQRRGLGISFGQPMYVVDKNVDTNTVVIGKNEDLFRKSLVAYECNWISIPTLTEALRLKAKIRYKQREQSCTVFPLKNGEVYVEFDEPQRAITRGQRAVFYDNDIVVGGGIIK